MTEEMPGRARSLAILLLCQVAAMACWFASNASIAAIKAQQPLSPFFAALLTSSVQAGFVAGAFVSALLALPDRLDKRLLFRFSALVAALCTGSAALLPPTSPVAPVLRFITGVSLAGVYPVGMAMAATWARGDLGLLIGLLVAALTLGSASPHLAAALGGLDWRAPILFASGGALLSALLAGFIGLGPNVARAPEFHWSNVLLGWRSVPLRLSNFGYFGHQWELYAMWAWIGAFVAASFRARYGDAPPLHPALATFFIVSSGALGRAAWWILRGSRRPHPRHQRRHGRIRPVLDPDRLHVRRFGLGAARGRIGLGNQRDRGFGAIFRLDRGALRAQPARRHADCANLRRLPADPRQHPFDALCGGLARLALCLRDPGDRAVPGRLGHADAARAARG